MVLQARSISKSYGKLQVLRGVDLEIARGELLSIVGPSGAGKSTLLQILGTLDRPDAGSLTIEGKDPSRMGARELAAFRNRNIGFVFQFHHLLPEFTALENVCMPGWIAGRDERQVRSEAAAVLERMGLADRTGHKPTELSGGEQQRVSIARALLNRPALVLADEPTGNLDSRNAESLHQIFTELRKDLKQTFVIVTHNPSLATLSDRILEMRDGILFDTAHLPEQP